MSEKTTEEKVGIMVAFLNGETIEFKGEEDDDWHEIAPGEGVEISWDWMELDYRIKNVDTPRCPWCGDHLRYETKRYLAEEYQHTLVCDQSAGHDFNMYAESKTSLYKKAARLR